MATVKFQVENLNPDYEIPAGSGVWLDLRNPGGLDRNTDDDGTDDVEVAARGVFGNRHEPGIFIWIDNGDGENTFEVTGTQTAGVPDAGTQAEFLFNHLTSQVFAWQPKNPAYDTVAPLLKDGVTANGNFDPSGNPEIVVGGDTAQTVGTLCQHFKVTVTNV